MEKMLRAFTALKHKNFRLFWIALFVSQIATQMQVVAVNWQLYDLTKSAFSLGIVGIMGFIPVLLFSLVGGVAADKISRKKIMILCQSVLVCSSLILSVASFTNFISPLLIYLGIATYAFVLSFDLPARQAAIPSLVPENNFMNAVSLSTLGRQTALVLGPSVAGFLIEFFGVKSVYTANTFLFFISAITMLFVHISKIEHVVKTTFSIRSVREGLHFVLHSPIILSGMLLDFIATFFASATVLLPIYATDILHIGAKGIGVLYAAPAVGAVIAGFVVSSLGTLKYQGKIILLSVLAFGLATVGFGLSSNFFLSCFFLACIGASDIVGTIIRNTMRQLVTPDYIRGRMVSINMIFFTGGPNLGEAEAGFVAGLLGAPFSVISGGVATIFAVVVIAFLFPQLRKYSSESRGSRLRVGSWG